VLGGYAVGSAARRAAASSIGCPACWYPLPFSGQSMRVPGAATSGASRGTGTEPGGYDGWYGYPVS
jgi:hypothetical protein